MRTRRLLLRAPLITLGFVGHAWFIGQPCLAADYTGRVIGVIDGDTIEVLNGHYAERIRLSGRRALLGSREDHVAGRFLTLSLAYFFVLGHF